MTSFLSQGFGIRVVQCQGKLSPHGFRLQFQPSLFRNLFFPNTSAWCHCGFTDKFSALWGQPTAAPAMNLRPFQPVLPSKGRPKALPVPQSLPAASPSWSSTCRRSSTLSPGRTGLRRLGAPGLRLPEQRHPSLCGFVCSYPTLSPAGRGCTTAVPPKLSSPG